MGNTISTYIGGSNNGQVTVNGIDHGTGIVIYGDKNTHYSVPESEFDSHHISEDDHQFITIDCASLFSYDVKSVGQKIVEAMRKDNVVVLKSSSDVYSKTVQLRKNIEDYLSLPLEKKKQFGNPEKKDGVRHYYSGYSQIHFENRDNIRDPEWRDVFQVRLAEDGRIFYFLLLCFCIFILLFI
eukprot:TRINITY_DN1497_c0_g1_i2.p1 TRINITY_DN1497_c0_g1~~TRINITY_DN1497_c0_g1_i2.p1  ORF type:complete len:183 (-),score=42.14 TRINITY_DN1497_c0_g1_i2:10-558(-)